MMYQTTTMKQLEQMLDCHGDIFLLDVRNRVSYEICHVEEAISTPCEELDEKMESLPKDKTVVCYYAGSGQSMLACNHLSATGYSVVNTTNRLSSYRGKYLVKGQNLRRQVESSLTEDGIRLQNGTQVQNRITVP